MMLITVSEDRLMLAPGNDVIFPHQTWEDYERLLNLRQDKTLPKPVKEILDKEKAGILAGCP